MKNDYIKGRPVRKRAVVVAALVLALVFALPYGAGGFWADVDSGGAGGSPALKAVQSFFDADAYAATKTVKATFNASKGKVGGKAKLTKKIAKGKKLGKLPKAKYAGYKFKGWYTKKTGGKKISKNTKIKKNTTYYAQWTYVVKFDTDGGTVGTKSKTVTLGAKYGALPIPTKKGSTFLGWYTAKTGGTLIAAATKVSRKTATLYARWRVDGTVWSWGHNQSYQLGHEKNLGGENPNAAQVPDLSGIISVASSRSTVYALKNDGTVWAWGDNSYGRMGVGITGSSYMTSKPQKVYGLAGVVAIAAGAQSAYALSSSGKVYAWGQNDYGQLGNSTDVLNYTPKLVDDVIGSPLHDIVAISAYDYSAYAVRNDGTVWAWGRNFCGELGNGSTNDSSSPVRVKNLYDVKAVEACNAAAFAIKNDGTVWVWGDKTLLGYNSTLAVQITGVSDITDIRSDASTPYLLKKDGTVWSWGYNYWGQVGDGTTTDRATPVKVSGLTNVVAIGCTESSGYAVKKDGTVWAWGFNLRGQLGDGTTTNRSKPVQVKGVSGAVDIEGGDFAAFAIVGKA